MTATRVASTAGRAAKTSKAWRVRFLRLMDYEGIDQPAPIPAIDLSPLLPSIQLPTSTTNEEQRGKRG